MFETITMQHIITKSPDQMKNCLTLWLPNTAVHTPKAGWPTLMFKIRWLSESLCLQTLKLLFDNWQAFSGIGSWQMLQMFKVRWLSEFPSGQIGSCMSGRQTIRFCTMGVWRLPGIYKLRWFFVDKLERACLAVKPSDFARHQAQPSLALEYCEVGCGMMLTSSS